MNPFCFAYSANSNSVGGSNLFATLVVVVLVSSLVNSGASAAGVDVFKCGGASAAGVHMAYMFVPRLERPLFTK